MDNYRIFLSSTFRDLKNERAAVESVIQRMGDFYVGMEHFGSSPNAPLEECLAQVRTAHMVVLVLGYSHGSMPKRRKRSFVEREFLEARQNSIPIIAYVADREVYAPKGEAINPNVLRIRSYLREELVAQCFRSKEDLAQQVAADLGRELRKRSDRFNQDAVGGLVSSHDVVVAAIKDGELDRAEKENEFILGLHQYSPRGHFNHACILALKAQHERDPQTKEKLLVTARSRLHDSLKLGMLQFIQIFADKSDPANSDPHGRIVHESDLRALFERWPSLKEQVLKGFVAVPRQMCSC